MGIDKMNCGAAVENLATVAEFVEECADRFGLDSQKKVGALVALEEAFINICRYVYPDGVGEVEISCGADGDALVIEIADKGSPFDIMSLPKPDTTLDIMDREIGGLGVHLIRTLSDGVSYRLENDKNILRMVFQRIQTVLA